VVIHLSNLYEIFGRDFLSDSLALTNIAKRISGNINILILFNQSSHVAFTDGSFIYLPRKTKDDIPSAQGLVAHESGHIGYGSYELSFIKLTKTISVKHSLPDFLVKKVINVVEDVRINSINNNKFPGFYKNLRRLTKNLIPELKVRMKKSGDILVYINLFMEDYKDFQKKPKFRSKLMTEEDWNAISVAKAFLLKALTPASSIIAIDQLCKILKKYYRKKTIRRIPTQRQASSQGSYQEKYYEEDFGYDVVGTEIESTSIENYEPDDEQILNSDFMEDPCYYDESVYEDSHEFNYVENEPLLNHYEDFSETREIMEKTELNETSEKLIDKIKETNLATEDIKKLIEQVDSIKEEQKKIAKSNINKDTDGLNNDLKDLIENIKEKFNPEMLGGSQTSENLFNDLDCIEVLTPSILNELDYKKEDLEKGGYLEEFIKILADAQNAMEDRLSILEKGTSFQKLSKGNRERNVKDVRIENENMKAIGMSYNQIIKTHKNLIARIKLIFRDFRNQIDIDNFQKRGRLNSKFIKAVTSDYKYKKCFSRKIKQKELKILLLVDISGSMSGKKLEVAKIAMIMLCEAIYDIAQLRIVLFTGDYDALNILLKDFNDKPDPIKFDKFGCHSRVGSNLDGVSMKHEAEKLEKDVLIMIISDGQPAGSDNYGLYDAVKEIHDVKKVFNVFAFSIDAKGEYLDQLYDKNWILTTSKDRTDLGDKLIKFCKFVVKEFFR
jgi:Mg-chelatase subunit ChlD